jgi:peptide/nickel transport system permease protein
MSLTPTDVPTEVPLLGPSVEAEPAAGRLGRLRGHPVARFLVSRTIFAGVVLLVASLLVFAATSLLPGDVASNILGRNGTPEQIARLREALGTDEPVIAQYWHWLSGLVTGDLGSSAVATAQASPVTAVSELISDPLRNSIALAAFAALFLIPLSLALGVYAGVRAGRAADMAISAPSIALAATPEFVLGTLLVLLFSQTLDMLPSVSLLDPGQSPLSVPEVLVLPAATLVLVASAAGIRMIRAGMISVLGQEYVTMARLNGFPERRVIWQFAIRNALAPTVQILAEMLRYLFAGIIVVEAVFDYPGLGTALVRSVNAQDAPMVAAVAMIIAVAYMAINTLADLLVLLLVPRLRTGSGR